MCRFLSFYSTDISCFITKVIVVISLLIFASESVAVEPPFACGGQVENEVWDLWDSNVKTILLEKQLQNRLVKLGDVYALYDFQSYTHNLVEMAQRCNRINRLQDISHLIEIAYSKLEITSSNSKGRQWICHGGWICNDKNKLLNHEVPLDSLQFLSVAATLANALATSNVQLTGHDKNFVQNTAQIIIEHMLRWSDKESLDVIRAARNSSPKDVKGGSSALFFTNYPLYMISVYSDLSGMLNYLNSQGITQISASDKAQLTKHLNELLPFFLSRLSFQQEQNSRLGNIVMADVDRGYWRLFADNTYAGYENPAPPVSCIQVGNKFEIKVNVPVSKVPKIDNIGWDISHARSLVHAMNSIERNRQSLKTAFGLRDDQLPPTYAPEALANSLVGRVWNGDKDAPLFSNHLSGANGWYRVAYDNGTGQCREGYPPFGLSDSFTNGGYPTWAKYNPKIGILSKQLYSLINSTKQSDANFVAKYYPQLGKSTDKINYALAKMMFLPSIVGVSIK